MQVPAFPRASLATALAALLLACSAPSGPGGSAPNTPPPGLFSSTIDPLLQPFAEAELQRALDEWQAPAGAIVVLEPGTGSILANAGRSRGKAANVALENAYVTGSTLKTITLAAALEERAVTLSDRFDCEMGARSYGDLVLRDAGKHGVLSAAEILRVSSNIGFSKIFDRLGGDKLAHWLHRFHFAEAPALPGAAAGELIVPIEDRSFHGGVVAAGEAMKATPLQMALAYAVIANDGEYVPPTLVPRTGEVPRERILKPETARALIPILEQVVSDKDGTGHHARLAGVRVAGKTGTGEWALPEGGSSTYVSFVGFFPAEKPRFLILVGIEGPRAGGSGGEVAAPVFAKIAARALGR
ncbi:MAG: penicillin-binding transpeptidase domain-containing protein [Minicystis sp.]